MVGFSTDYKNFETQYEPKLQRKIDWINKNKILVTEHFQRLFPGKKFDIKEFDIEGLFIINTPTFYMMNGKYKTINIGRLNDFIKSYYELPVIQLSDDGEVFKEIKYPYFKIQ